MSKLTCPVGCPASLDLLIFTSAPLIGVMVFSRLPYSGIGSIAAGLIYSHKIHKYVKNKDSNMMFEYIKSSLEMTIKIQHSYSAIKVGINFFGVLNSAWNGKLNINDNIDWYNFAEFSLWSLIGMNPIISLQTVITAAINVMDIDDANKVIDNAIELSKEVVSSDESLTNNNPLSLSISIIGDQDWGYFVDFESPK